MFSKKYRLNLSKKDNQRMFERGQSNFFSGQKLIFYERDNSSLANEAGKEIGLRVAALAPKRLFPKAAARTRARRQLYQSFEQVTVSLEEKQALSSKSFHHDFIVVLKTRLFTQEELFADILKALNFYEII